jgi:hypothetical protein
MTRQWKVQVGLIMPSACASALCGCQSTLHGQAELARICADPATRTSTPANLYDDECRAL